MKARTALHIIIGSLIAVTLIYFASSLQAGSGSGLADLVNVQRKTPVLWVVDACALGFFGAMWWYAVMLNNFKSFMDYQAERHYEQLEEMIQRTNDLEKVNDDYADRIDRLEAEITRQGRDYTDQIATLEAAADARQKVFEIETRRIAEQSYRSFQAQLDTNSRQVEAMIMALRFQRGELRQLRHDLRSLQNGLGASHPSLFPISDFIGSASVPTPELPSGEEHPVGARIEAWEALEEGPTAPALPAGAAESEVLAVVEQSDAGAEAAPEPPSTPEWAAEYAEQSERPHGWRSQVERLFYEAQALETLPDVETSARTPLAAVLPQLRMLNADAGMEAAQTDRGDSPARETKEEKKPVDGETSEDVERTYRMDQRG